MQSLDCRIINAILSRNLFVVISGKWRKLCHFTGTHNQIVFASIFLVFWFSTGLQGKRGVQINLGASNFKYMFQKLENSGFQESRQIQAQQKILKNDRDIFNVKFCIKINHLVDLVVERIDLFC